MRINQRALSKKLLVFVLTAMMAVFSALTVCAEGSGEEVEEMEKAKPGDLYRYDDSRNLHPGGFFVPTQVYGVNGEFFVLDAYNQQILYTRNCSDHPASWNRMGDKLNRPHAIASDGVLYVVVDTDNNRLVTYTKNRLGFQVVECFENVGVRPHYIEYDAATGQFYVWSSMTGTMYIYERAADSLMLTLKEAAYIKDLDGCYTRSFTIDGDEIYLPSWVGKAIYVVDKNSFKVKAVYSVSEELGGMVQVLHEQNYYYLVTSTDLAGDHSKATIVRSESISGFVEGGYEDVKGMFPEMEGIPYYITRLEDGHYYTPILTDQIAPYICRFDIIDDQITNVTNFKY